MTPGQARRSLRDLRTRHYAFVSTVSVYADTTTPGLTEEGPLLPPLDSDAMTSTSEYGPAKVACERLVLDAFGREAATIVRAGLIGGDGDTSGRSGYWPWRFAHPSGADGCVLVPPAEGLTVQLIDVRDLAARIVHVVEHRVGGVFNAVGDAVPFADALDAARDASGVGASERTLVTRDGDWLRANDVAPWAGPGSLPLWLDDPDRAGFPARSNAAATAAGLTLRPLADTFRAALAYHDARGEAPASGLSDERERELLALPA
jgi:2'-hydroxyisoflavone reductase